MLLTQAVAADETSFPEFAGVKIEGAPKLGKPTLVMGGKLPVTTEKHGLAAPAFFDWDRDGKRDLLIGEFESNTGDRYPMGEDGSTVRIYRNIGSVSNPAFSDVFEWARDTEGTVIEVEQWCCIGFTPNFYDLDNDGFVDMITGQYHPGDVTWFRGSAVGFLPGVKLRQKGDPASAMNPLMEDEESPEDETETLYYWVYSSTSMGDFDGDGDYDLIMGGSGGLRISENIGSPQKPRFGKRELLRDEQGEPLVLRILSPTEKALNQQILEPVPAGDRNSSPFVVDWDRDGVLDLLVTGSYINPGDPAVMFFKGVRTQNGYRFKQGVDLLATTDGSKALPGSGPRVFVDDWNGDGIHDLIIGTSVATVNKGKFSDELSWEWESINGVAAAGADPGRYPPPERPTKEGLRKEFEPFWEGSKEEFNELIKFNMELWDNNIGRLHREGKSHWLTMRHQGRVYVMLGSETEA